MKQVHAALRVLICLLLSIAWAKQAPPASPEQALEGAAVTEERLARADAAAVPDDVEADRSR